MDTNKKAIGRRIRAIRERLQLNQKEFGELVGCSNSMISSYEIGDQLPPLGKLMQIVSIGREKLKGISFDWVIFGVDMPSDRNEISEEEIQLLQMFRQLREEDRKAILRIAENAMVAKECQERD